MLESNGLLFYILASIVLFSSLGIVVFQSPIHSAFSLVITMITLAFVYYSLEAPFIAGVQLVVYAGAVMVLFVMVLMLFDSNNERENLTREVFSLVLKITVAGLTGGLIWGIITAPKEIVENNIFQNSQGTFVQMDQIKAISKLLFTEYVFLFEVLGVLLLLVAVGVVTLSRTKGGTHGEL